MTEPGIQLFDLAAGYRCEECSQPKVNRLLGLLTGCPACDEVVTRHDCPARPALASVTEGTRWKCWECCSIWVAKTVTERCGYCCDECDHMITRLCWDLAEDRRALGPRSRAVGYTPTRPLTFPVYPDNREAEEQDRRDWLAGIVERLGLKLMDESG